MLSNSLNTEKCLTLLKEATALKNSDIEQAINKIKEAISLGDELAFTKLANYVFLAGRHDESLSLLQHELQNAFSQKSMIHKEMAKYYFKLHNFEKFFYHCFFSIYEEITINFTFMQQYMLDAFFKTDKHIEFIGLPNFEKALVKIGKKGCLYLLEIEVHDFFLSIKEKLYCALEKKTIFISKTEEQMIHYEIFSSISFEVFFKERIIPILF